MLKKKRLWLAPQPWEPLLLLSVITHASPWPSAASGRGRWPR